MVWLVLVTGLLLGPKATPKETRKEMPNETRKETPKAKSVFPEAATTVTITKGTKDTFKAVRVKAEEGYRIKLVTSSDLKIETTSVLVKNGGNSYFIQVDAKNGQIRIRGLHDGQEIEYHYIQNNHPLNVLPAQPPDEGLFPLSGLPAQPPDEGLFPRSGLRKP